MDSRACMWSRDNQQQTVVSPPKFRRRWRRTSGMGRRPCGQDGLPRRVRSVDLDTFGAGRKVPSTRTASARSRATAAVGLRQELDDSRVPMDVEGVVGSPADEVGCDAGRRFRHVAVHAPRKSKSIAVRLFIRVTSSRHDRQVDPGSEASGDRRQETWCECSIQDDERRQWARPSRRQRGRTCAVRPSDCPTRVQ